MTFAAVPFISRLSAAARFASSGPAVRHGLTLTAVAWALSSGMVHAAAGSRLIEVRDADQVYTGRLVAMDDTSCVIFDRAGVMHTLRIKALTGFERVAEHYQPLPVSEFRTRLIEEFPKGYQLAGTSHYLVCGPQGKSQTYADLFESVYRNVDTWYRRRGFRISPPETPLVAIVFGTRSEFRNYCLRDDVAWSPGLRGYYSLKTNRIAMYDDPRLISAADPAALRQPVTPLAPRTGILSQPGQGAGAEWASGPAFRLPDPDTGIQAAFRLSGNTAGTIVHEATHQVSYNIGVHSRAGVTPTWVTEGLATLLEAPGTRNTRSSHSISSRVNQERLDWFRSRYTPKRRNGDLARLVSADTLFERQTLDAYSLAWAFTFFLAENPTHTREFIDYLKTVSERDPMSGYTTKERLNDFTAAFGDPARMEVEFLRFMDRL